MKTTIPELLERIHKASKLGVIKNLRFAQGSNYPSSAKLMFYTTQDMAEDVTEKLRKHLLNDCEGIISAHVDYSMVEIWYRH
jgi:hypothetical protein